MFEIVFERASDSLIDVFRAAVDECARLDNRWVCTEHILMALSRDTGHVAGQALDSMKIGSANIEAEVDKRLNETTGSEPLFSERTEVLEPPSDKPKLRVFSREEQGHEGIAFSQMVIEALKRSNEYSL